MLHKFNVSIHFSHLQVCTSDVLSIFKHKCTILVGESNQKYRKNAFNLLKHATVKMIK